MSVAWLASVAPERLSAMLGNNVTGANNVGNLVSPESGGTVKPNCLASRH